jgi:hypothetical protein
MDKSKMTTVRTVSLYDVDRAIITQLAQQHGFTFSQSIRFIVRSWARRPGETMGAHEISTGDPNDSPDNEY